MSRAFFYTIHNFALWLKPLKTKQTLFNDDLLRKVIRVNWPRTISNESLYDRTHMKPWSILMMKRRLSWFGHLMRLPSDTPARPSLRHFVKPVKRPIERPKTTWLSTVVNDLKEHSSIQIHQNLDTALQQLEIMCSDRKLWTETVCGTMLSKMTNVHWWWCFHMGKNSRSTVNTAKTCLRNCSREK